MGNIKACAPYVAMILVQLAYGGSNILGKLALRKGLSYLVFIVYRHLIAMLILGPFAYALERKKHAYLTFPVVMKIFLLSMLGTTIHGWLYYAGLDYTTPTVAGALSNVVPGLTFMLAILFRMEKLQIGSIHGRAKLIGATICIGGALLFTLWKGYLFKGVVGSPLIDVHNNGSSRHKKDDWIKGAALIFTGNCAWSSWLILQAVVYKVYPARLSMNTLICFFASLQCSVLSLFFDRKSSSWKLQWDVQLLTIIYCGTVNSALVYSLQTWCITEKGPVFAAMFSPLLLVIIAIFSAFVFAERLHLGSLIGAFLIILGLYCVLWGKNRDTLVEHDKEKQVDEKSLPDRMQDVSKTDQSINVIITQVKNDNN
ncbi:WAT1-related protein At1g43650-like [Tasmannia lanceolata]|uniref:WAT1-related protein At1g43650-like n=1 Tax=Tasmannia lanceolata TaxID=3420 RepID=UPI004062E54A